MKLVRCLGLEQRRESVEDASEAFLLSGMSHHFPLEHGEILKVAFMWLVQLVMTELGKVHGFLTSTCQGFSQRAWGVLRYYRKFTILLPGLIPYAESNIFKKSLEGKRTVSSWLLETLKQVTGCSSLIAWHHWLYKTFA